MFSSYVVNKDKIQIDAIYSKIFGILISNNKETGNFKRDPIHFW